MLGPHPKLAPENSRSLNEDTLNNIVDIKNSINNSRIDYEDYIISNEMVTKNWLAGFIEGDGTFYFSNSSVVFGITQKDQKILEAIAYFGATKYSTISSV